MRGRDLADRTSGSGVCTNSPAAGGSEHHRSSMHVSVPGYQNNRVPNHSGRYVSSSLFVRVKEEQGLDGIEPSRVSLPPQIFRKYRMKFGPDKTLPEEGVAQRLHRERAENGEGLTYHIRCRQSYL